MFVEGIEIGGRRTTFSGGKRALVKDRVEVEVGRKSQGERNEDKQDITEEREKEH